MTTKVDAEVTVDRPLRTVYDQWTQFEEFPRFMGGVEQVVQLDDRTLHWVAEIAGVRREWDATIVEQEPDRRIAWAATGGTVNAGEVRFEAAAPERTTVRLHLEYDVEGALATVGDALHLIQRQAHADLEHFKEFIEAEGHATGAWRGRIEEGAGPTGEQASRDRAATETRSAPDPVETGDLTAGAVVREDEPDQSYQRIPDTHQSGF